MPRKKTTKKPLVQQVIRTSMRWDDDATRLLLTIIVRNNTDEEPTKLELSLTPDIFSELHFDLDAANGHYPSLVRELLQNQSEDQRRQAMFGRLRRVGRTRAD